MKDWLVPPLILATFLLPRAKILAEDNPLPCDFKINAEYGAGYSSWTSWEVTITGDGRVLQEYFDEKQVKKRSSISKADLRALWVKINEASFFKLQPEYSVDVEDNPTLIMTITANKMTHRVMVYAPDHLEDHKDVKRFFRVWSEVLKKVPSPNPDQKPDLYKP
jgi:hypothetical protein